MGEHSLLLVDGAEHKRARKLLMPAFSGQALRGYEDLVVGLAKTEVGSWAEGRPFRALDRMNALTLEVILHVVFGVTDERRLAELRPLVNATDVSSAVLPGWGAPAAEVRRLASDGRDLLRARPAAVRRDRRHPAGGSRPGRTHRRPLPADPRRRRGRPAHRPRAARPAGDAACRARRRRRPWRGRCTRSAATPPSWRGRGRRARGR
ncbi:MAG: hypothetical protein R2734_13685 [Nocardioides sp.]